MKRINEVRQSRTRLLSVCGEQIKALLTGNNQEWLHDIDSFLETAVKVDEQLSLIASDDRISVIEKYL